MEEVGAMSMFTETKTNDCGHFALHNRNVSDLTNFFSINLNIKEQRSGDAETEPSAPLFKMSGNENLSQAKIIRFR